MPEIQGSNPYIPVTFYGKDGQLTTEGAAKADKVSAGIQALADKMPEAEREIFKGLLGNSLLAPKSDLSTDEIIKSAGKLAELATLIASLPTGDTAALIARLMIEQASDQRKSALDDRLAAREQATADLRGQADDMKKSAEALSSSALTSLIVGVVFSAVSLLATAGAALGSIKGLRELGDLAKNNVQAGSAALSKVTSSLEQVGRLGQAGNTLNSMGSTIAGYFSTMGQAESKNLEASGSDKAALAQVEQSNADIAKDIHQAIDDMLKAIVNFLKEMQDAENQMMQSMTKV